MPEGVKGSHIHQAVIGSQIDVLPGLLILVGGAVYTILTGGMLYLFLGIYQNTKKTAEALQQRGL